MRQEEQNKRETTTEEERTAIEGAPIEQPAEAEAEPETLTRKSKRAAQRLSQANRGKKLAIAFVALWAVGLFGLAIGYSVVGDGSFADAFKPGTYKHMYDLVFKTNP